MEGVSIRIHMMVVGGEDRGGGKVWVDRYKQKDRAIYVNSRIHLVALINSR